MHTRAVPVSGAERFTMPVNGNTVLLSGSFQKIPGHPHLVSGSFSPFREYLKLPLTGSNFGIYTLDIDTSFQAEVKMRLNDFTTESVFSANRAVVRTLWPGISASREAEWLVGLRAPKKIFLLEAEPEVVVVIINCCAPV